MTLRLPLATALGAVLFLPFAPAGGADLDSNPIQPGDVATMGGAQCTLNFVFDGGGKTYVGIAGHCGSVGNQVSTTGHTNFGTIVYDDDIQADFALIEVKAAQVSSVSGVVKGHPGMPTGFTADGEPNTGDVILFSGYGLGFGSTQATQEERVGVLYSTGTSGYCGFGPAIFGDSGGPVLHQETGKALGMVNELGCVGTVSGTLTWSAIQRATSQGFVITLRTA